jgi:integrase
MRLTDQGIRGLPFTETGQRHYHDDTVRGLSVCVGRRTKTFTVIVRKRRYRKRHTIGQYDPPHFTLAMAREKARDMLALERLTKTETPRITFEEALETYYRVHVANLRKQSIRGICQTLDRRFRPKLGTKALADIRPIDIAPLVDAMVNTPTEMHNAFVYLAMFFNWCMKRGYIEVVPTARMRTPRKPPSRERILSAAELVSVWRAAPHDDYGRIVRLCILSGQRIGQWAALRQEYVADDTISWPAGVMKANRSHTLPLTPSMRALLPDRVGLLFPTENARAFSNWSRSKHRLDIASGIERYTHHDLRRTWATIAAEELEIQPHIIESVLAHSLGTAVSRVYNRARYLEPMRTALEAFQRWFEQYEAERAIDSVFPAA